VSATAVAIPTALTSIAARLTAPEDRETYAGLISYFNSIPEHDELFRLVELLGLLTLLSQHIPDAIAEMLVELRAQSTAASDYHAQVDARLASLPEAIAAGVDVEAMAKDMAEGFRQQLAATGLETTANLLRNASKEITALSGQISASLKPAAAEYENTSATISRELARLTSASDELRRHNAQLMAQERSNNWWMQGFMMLSILLAGLVAGVTMEKSGTTEALRDVGAQMERIQAPAAVPVAASTPKKSRKQSGGQ
jgi:beta-glucosidase-like glycosyl hydrolase